MYHVIPFANADICVERLRRGYDSSENGSHKGKSGIWEGRQQGVSATKLAG